ncbi:MAG: hypothetical protein H0T89_11725 [Deltaproteobacteria bacterium]|nr:hypothetical protein [Deltaproteobacteria bacterium]MDQ3301252.1 hypothetical protein [Myxococcota bacterium]
MEARPQSARSQPRFWVALQPTIVRLYKVAGLIALTAILVGLIGFLVVNIFYFFDHSWVRPVVLSPTHQKVVEASTQLADSKLRAAELMSEKFAIEAQLSEIDRTVAADERFIAEVGAQADHPKSPEQWLFRRELEKAKLDKDNSIGRRAPLGQRLESIKLRMEDQDKVVRRLAQSPYLRAIDQRVVLAFVPYTNLRNVKLGTKLYGCAWGLIACKTVGKVTAVLDGEVTDIHPHDETVQRGVMVEIDVASSAAGDSVLFAGSKPLWLF